MTGPPCQVMFPVAAAGATSLPRGASTPSGRLARAVVSTAEAVPDASTAPVASSIARTSVRFNPTRAPLSPMLRGLTLSGLAAAYQSLIGGLRTSRPEWLRQTAVAADKHIYGHRCASDPGRIRRGRRGSVGASEALAARARAPDLDGRRTDRRGDRGEALDLGEDDAQPPARAADEDARPDADAHSCDRVPPRAARSRAARALSGAARLQPVGRARGAGQRRAQDAGQLGPEDRLEPLGGGRPVLLHQAGGDEVSHQPLRSLGVSLTHSYSFVIAGGGHVLRKTSDRAKTFAVVAKITRSRETRFSPTRMVPTFRP